MINQSGLSLIPITVLQSDVSGEVIKILQEDGGMSLPPFNTFHLVVFYSVTWSFTRLFFLSLLNMIDSVGYGDALIAVLPSFPGIKKLQ